MIFYKKLTPEEVLNALALFIKQSLPGDIKNSDAEINLFFNPDNSVEIYLTKIKESNNTVLS